MEIRGVGVSANIVRTLIERDWVHVVGHRDVPGRPEMFGTTKAFLDYFGLKKLDDLPPLADLSDWESLRVQLNLPEVEEDLTGDTEEVSELPVLYPEIGVEDQAPEPMPVEEQLAVTEEVPIEDDDLIITEWPDPADSTG